MGRFFLPLLMLCAFAASAHASDTPAIATQKGAPIYQARCAQCHDHPSGRIPPHYILNHKTADQVVQILTTGPMRQQAAGLSPDDIRELATFISFKRPGSWTDPDPAANRCTGTGRAAGEGPGDWNGWGRDMANTRLQPDAGIAAGDVPRLKLKWAFAYPGGETSGEPIAVGGRLYVVSAAGRVFALDAKTGCTWWSFDAGAPVKNAVSVGPFGANRAVYFGDMGGTVHALDASTGREIWQTKASDHPLAQVRGSPKLYKGTLYVPVSSGEEAAAEDPGYPCCTFRGTLVAMDAATGKVLWKTYSIPEAPKPAGKNPAGTQTYAPSGAAIWGSPTIDEKRGRIYVGTGNGYSGDDSPGGDSVMAFDLKTGKQLWTTRGTAKDVYVVCLKQGTGNCPAEIGPDFDFGSATVLATMPDGKQFVLAGQKSGVVFAFDPDTGKIAWKVKLAEGGAFGGIEHGITTDGAHVFVPISDVGTSVAVPKGQDAPHKQGGIVSLDVATGKQNWRTPAPDPAVCSWGTVSCAAAQPASPTAIPGIVFSGSLDGHIRAYAAADGKIVWDFDTGRTFPAVNGADAHGGAVTGYGQTVANGILYVNSGGGYYGPAGNALLAFSVDGK